MRRAFVVALALALAGLAAAPARAQVPAASYKVETLRGPTGVAFEVSGLDFSPEGTLYAAFRKGTIYTYEPATGQWRRFASGLRHPMGLLVPKADEIFVAQLPELTRVVDQDHDGIADLYETVADDWGLSGNYHEFVGNPVRDPNGTFYLPLGSSSGVAKVRPPTRGPLMEGVLRAKEEKPDQVNRVIHNSPVPYRGCVVKIAAGGKVTPFACGFRQPNGIVRAPDGALFVTDNQGDWVGTSPLYHVTEGGFYGHPGSLHWLPSWKRGPAVNAPIADLEKIRKVPAIQFDYNEMAGSVAQPVVDLTGGQFGPYAGQMIIAEWTNPRLVRADLERVGGEYQGAAFIFLEGQGLRPAGIRLAFAPDGKSLYVGQTSRVWGGVEGMQRVTFTGKVPLDIVHMRLSETGFELDLTKPVDPKSASTPDAWPFSRYRYLYHAQYGSPKADLAPVKTTAVKVSPDGKHVSIRLESLEAGWLYELRPQGVHAPDGEALSTRLALYTLNRLKGRVPGSAKAQGATASPTAPAPAFKAANSGAPIRIGLVGLDTTHVTAFTAILNDPTNPEYVPGARVVAAYKGGSPDVVKSATRIEGFTATLRDKWKVKLVDSVEDLVRQVDAVIINSLDGRKHLGQARPVFKARKPVFIDKPLSGDYKEAAEIVRLARESATPLFSASGMRFHSKLANVAKDPRLLGGAIRGAFTYGPSPIEPHVGDLFYYGIHAVEALFTIMGPGCASVSRVYTPGADVVIGRWNDGRIGTVRELREGAEPFGAVVFGDKAVVPIEAKDESHRVLVSEIVKFFQTGKPPVSADETLEIIGFMEAADVSKKRGGAEVSLEDLKR